MLKKIAQSFSLFFHPLLMTTFGIVIIMFTNSYVSYIPLQAKKMLIILTAIGTFVLPALLVPLFLLQGKISSAIIDDRKERLYPLALTSVFYLLTFILFLKIPVFHLVHAFMLSSLLSVFISFMVSLRYKISTHMMGLGGVIALVIALSVKLDLNMLYPLIGVVTAAGLAGSSRLYLNAHTESEVYTGFVLGFVLVLITLFVY